MRIITQAHIIHHEFYGYNGSDIEFGDILNDAANFSPSTTRLLCQRHQPSGHLNVKRRFP